MKPSRPSAWALRVARRFFDGDIEAVAHVVDEVRDLAIRASIDVVNTLRVHSLPNEPPANEAVKMLHNLFDSEGLPWPSRNTRRRVRTKIGTSTNKGNR